MTVIRAEGMDQAAESAAVRICGSND